eukprot:gene8756-biopygen21175
MASGRRRRKQPEYQTHVGGDDLPAELPLPAPCPLTADSRAGDGEGRGARGGGGALWLSRGNRRVAWRGL